MTRLHTVDFGPFSEEPPKRRDYGGRRGPPRTTLEVTKALIFFSLAVYPMDVRIVSPERGVHVDDDGTCTASFVTDTGQMFEVTVKEADG